MKSDKICPILYALGKECHSTLCLGDHCAWWDEKENMCKLVTSWRKGNENGK